ncbi:MAG: DNA methyltransferase, partial [Desulfobacterium sp.]
MPTTDKLRKKLQKKLAELFQLDQPDLDFGFYRIIKAKAEQVQTFIDKDLLQTIENAFGQVDEERKDAACAAVETAIEQAKKFGVPDPEKTDGVQEARTAYIAIKENATAESDVYDHLFRFFERYYDDGDFISRRYYTRENAGHAAPFAIPYNGEEVKLHWANADQYYIKTAEYFSNYTFDMVQASEIRKMSEQEKALNLVPDTPLKVHFRIIDAAEGEHGNVKGAADQKRFFVLYEQDPVTLNDAGELVVNFEYKPMSGGKNIVNADAEKNLKTIYGKSLKKGDMPNLAIAQKVIDFVEASDNFAAYANMLKLPAPTDKIPNRPLLAKYINQYTARNTCDYFIHKDLGGFLKRELDFYIKNEVMHLDDIENADAPSVESYLAKLKVIRKIAVKLIEFLAQLENFQKKLWLKKKFVIETNYCITLDRVPQELYGQVVENPAQVQEWIKLFAIDEIKGEDGELPGMGGPSFSNPPTVEFLKANDKLVLDTAFFNEDFKALLIESIANFDEQCDGLLIHSENFQALNLLQERYREQVKCVYIDPPYNTGGDGFAYKDSYQHSSWLSMVEERVALSHSLICLNGAFFISIDEKEHHNLRRVTDNLIGVKNLLADFVWLAEGNFDNQAKVKMAHEYILAYAYSEPNFAPPPVIDPSITGKSKLFREKIKNTIIK